MFSTYLGENRSDTVETPLKLFKLPIKTKNTIFPPAVEIEKRDLQIMLYGDIKRKINDNCFYFSKKQRVIMLSVCIL